LETFAAALQRFLFLLVDENGSASGTRLWYQLSGLYADGICLRRTNNFSPLETDYHRHWRD
jgi:hypothetical protein